MCSLFFFKFRAGNTSLFFFVISKAVQVYTRLGVCVCSGEVCLVNLCFSRSGLLTSGATDIYSFPGLPFVMTQFVLPSHCIILFPSHCGVSDSVSVGCFQSGFTASSTYCSFHSVFLPQSVITFPPISGLDSEVGGCFYFS